MICQSTKPYFQTLYCVASLCYRWGEGRLRRWSLCSGWHSCDKLNLKVGLGPCFLPLHKLSFSAGICLRDFSVETGTIPPLKLVTRIQLLSPQKECYLYDAKQIYQCKLALYPLHHEREDYRARGVSGENEKERQIMGWWKRDLEVLWEGKGKIKKMDFRLRQWKPLGVGEER